MSSSPEGVIFPDAFGFCGGVRAADDLLEVVSAEASQVGIPVYGYHAVVHNKDVTNKHEASGITFVGDLDAIPDQTAVVISAHGASPEVFGRLADKGCEVFDATCPLVIRTHRGAREARARDEKVLYICQGKPGTTAKLHDEVAGMQGHLDYELTGEGELLYHPVERAYFEIGDELTPEDLAARGKYRIIWQTTLRADAADAYRHALEAQIKAVQPEAVFGDIPSNFVCNAVQVRQEGVKKLVDLGLPRIVVVTDPTSKNGIEYGRMARELAGDDQQVHTVANAAEAAEFAGEQMLTGVTASASTPDTTIAEVVTVLGGGSVPETDKSFTLPDAKSGVVTARMAALFARRNAFEETL